MLQIVGGTMLAVLAVTDVASGQGWIEVGDASEIPGAGAQFVTGQGTLETITGSTDTGADDFVDAYVIAIVDAAAFYATTSGDWDADASAQWDTRLFLFAPDGQPLLANDDSPIMGSPQSYVSDPGLYGGVVDPSAQPLTNGIYIIAITGWANDPEDTAGLDLFALGSDFDALFGPAPGVGSFDHWENSHGLVQSGSYTIALQGAAFLPGGPSCPADVNDDLIVDVLDLVAVILDWGQSGVPADINADGTVDVLDLVQVILNWGPCG
jgi:hypothetical protein